MDEAYGASALFAAMWRRNLVVPSFLRRDGVVCFLTTVSRIGLCCLSTALLSIDSRVVNAETWASKMFSSTHHDFGSVSRNAKTEFAFVIENIYEEDLHIASVRSSCGCTKPVLTKRDLKTWEKTELVAQFNTRSFIGNKNAVVTVVFDRPYYAEVQLTVHGHIRSDIVVEPGEVNFGQVPVGTKRELPIRISYAGRQNWEIVDVRGDSEHLLVRMDPVRRQGNLVSYTMHVSVLETAPAGDLVDELIVITNDAKDNEFTLPTNARILAPVTVTPQQIALGSVTDGQTKSDRFVVKGIKPFRITEIQCGDDRFEFKVPRDAKPVHVIPFAFRGNGTPGAEAIQQSLLIKTDMGENIVAECIVTGQVVR
jgi:hypothetical protein